MVMTVSQMQAQVRSGYKPTVSNVYGSSGRSSKVVAVPVILQSPTVQSIASTPTSDLFTTPVEKLLATLPDTRVSSVSPTLVGAQPTYSSGSVYALDQGPVQVTLPQYEGTIQESVSKWISDQAAVQQAELLSEPDTRQSIGYIERHGAVVPAYINPVQNFGTSAQDVPVTLESISEKYPDVYGRYDQAYKNKLYREISELESQRQQTIQPPIPVIDQNGTIIIVPADDWSKDYNNPVTERDYADDGNNSAYYSSYFDPYLQSYGVKSTNWGYYRNIHDDSYQFDDSYTYSDNYYTGSDYSYSPSTSSQRRYYSKYKRKYSRYKTRGKYYANFYS